MKKDWIKLKEEVLGKKYELSLVFAKEELMEKLHQNHLKKNGATTVLSFSLSKNLGEIFLCPQFIKKEAKKYEFKYNEHLKKLFIHGLLHLKGMRHGEKMDTEEQKILRLKFNKPRTQKIISINSIGRS